jgi:hypothetical protein
MRNLPETPIIFLVYSPKSYFLAFGGPLYKAMHWPELRPQTRVSGLRLKLERHAGRVVTQVAFTGMRVVTQDFGCKSKLKYFVVTQVVRMSSRSQLEGPLYSNIVVLDGNITTS